MDQNHQSTRITNISWGRIEVSLGAEVSRFKDCKVWPGGARAWNWNETGTRHEPGIQPADIEELLDRGIDALVLSCGMVGRLRVTPEVLAPLESKKVEVHVERTKRAVEIFNELSGQGKRVGGLFHSTC